MQFTVNQINRAFKNKLKNIYSNAEIQQLLYFAHEKITKLQRTTLLTHPEKELPEQEFAAMNTVLERLATHEPIQYILGDTEFYGLLFNVNPSVLIPRPETEELVQWILTNHPEPNSRFLDIGTGSGCIAISLAKNLPSAKAYAADISTEAIKTAQSNALLNNTHINFIITDILNVAPEQLPGNLDILVSNPPYIRESEKELMQPNVLNFEPDRALFVPNNNPLLFYEAIAKIGVTVLRNNGSLFFEINEALADEVCEILKRYNYKNISVKRDINGKNRMTHAQKQ